MHLMLLGGAGLLAVILGGVMFSMSGKERLATPMAKSEGPSRNDIVKPIVSPKVRTPSRSEASILSEAEPIARQFLQAKSVDEMLPLIRHPNDTRQRLLDFYPQGKIEPRGLSTFNTNRVVTRKAHLIFITVTTGDFEPGMMAFIETPEGLKIDWESWVGWSEVPWEKFMADQPREPKIFRVTLSAVEYYNFYFADESKWQSYRLVSPDGNHSIYGYVENESLLDKRLRLNEDVRSSSFILSLKYPAGATDRRQVEIDRIIAEGWVETETP